MNKISLFWKKKKHIHIKLSSSSIWDCKFPNLKLRVSTQQHIKSLQVIFIREDLNYAIHQVELGYLIFAIHNLSNIIKEMEPFIQLEIEMCLWQLEI